MSFSIGPISLAHLEGHSWDIRRQTELVNIPFGRQTGFTSGAELVSYSLTGSFHADTVAEAKVIRRQLNELFNNPDIDFEYIQFDGDDDDELSGWFLLDQISTTITPGVLGNYPFTASVRRLGNRLTHFMGMYWKSNLYDNDYSLTGRTWVASPNKLGSIINSSRSGEDGSNLIVAPPGSSPVVYRDEVIFPDYYDMSCRVYEILSADISDALNSPSVSTRTEVFGREHVSQHYLGERIIVSNGLIAIVRNFGTILVYLYKSGSWVQIINEINFLNGAGMVTYVLDPRVPAIENISREKVTLKTIYGLYSAPNQDYLVVTYVVRRGTYFVDVKVETKGSADVGSISYLRASGTLSGLITAANYSVASMSDGKIGYLHTETASTSIAGSLLLTLGYSISANSTSRFAILAAPTTLPSGTTLANLGNEYIANVTQQSVLIDPRWL